VGAGDSALAKILLKKLIKLAKIEAKFGKKWLDLGKIKILYPQKHPISYGYTQKIYFPTEDFW